MRIDYISKALMTCDFASQSQKKQLTQQDRKLLLLCSEALLYPRRKIDLKIEDIKELIKKLENNPKIEKKGSCHFINSIFKAIANVLHLRIGFHRLDKTVHQAFEKSLKPKAHEAINPAYNQMISHVMRTPNLLPDQRHQVLETIQSFYLLSVHAPFFERNAQMGAKFITDFIEEKTGLSIGHWVPEITMQSVKNAPEMLMNKFLQAQNSNQLFEFFTKAFGNDDLTFELRYQRIASYGKNDNQPADIDQRPLYINENKNHFADLPQKPHEMVLEEPNYVELLEKDNNKIKEKSEILWGICETFQENQFINFDVDFGYSMKWKPMLSWYQIKEKILQHPDFLANYANTENFEKHLLNEEFILGRQCKDGQITGENLPRLIEDLFENGMLGKKQKPIPKPVYQPQWNDDINIPVDNKPEEPVLNNKTNEFTKPYEEIQLELDKHVPLYSKTVKELIDACYKISLYKEELIKNITRNNQGLWDKDYGWNGGKRLIGLVIHTEHTPEETLGIIQHAPIVFYDAFLKFKKEDKLKDFFRVLGTLGHNACIEGRLQGLQEYMVENEMIESVDDAIRLVPPVVPVVSKTDTKQHNIGRMLKVFTELQARKFYRDSGKTLDAEWLKVPGPKQVILENDKFQKEYNTKALFLKFLRDEAKIVGQETGDTKHANGAIFTEEDVEIEAQACKDADLLEVE